MKKQELLQTLKNLYGAIEFKNKIYYFNQAPYLTGNIEKPIVKVSATTKDCKSYNLIWENLKVKEYNAFEHICDWKKPDIIEEIETPEFIKEMLD